MSLSYQRGSSALGGIRNSSVTHKLEPVCFRIGLYELGYAPVDHPFGYHREMCAAHFHSQQWEDVLMVEVFPRHHFLAEPLRNHNHYPDIRLWEGFGVTHPSNLVKIV